MKHYNQPKTTFLQVMNNSIICTSAGPAPVGGFNGNLGSMSNTNKDW